MATQRIDSLATCFTRLWCEGPFRTPAGVSAYARNYVYNATFRSLTNHPEDNRWPRFSKPAAAHRIQQLKPPLLIMAGDKDIPYILTIAAWIQQQVKGSRKIIFNNVAHMLNLEIPGAFNKQLSAFIDNH